MTHAMTASDRVGTGPEMAPPNEASDALDPGPDAPATLDGLGASGDHPDDGRAEALGYLHRLGATLRGKLQFMDYLVRAVLDDADRFASEPDAGTRIFLRQLIEMHAANLVKENATQRQVDDLSEALEHLLALGAGGPSPSDADADVAEDADGHEPSRLPDRSPFAPSEPDAEIPDEPH